MKLILLVTFLTTIFCDEYEEGVFLARITSIDEHDAMRIGRKHGFEAERKLESYDDVYIGRRLERRKRGIEDEIVAEMMLMQQVQFIEKLHKFRRYKRAPFLTGGTPIHVWNLNPSMRIKEAWSSGLNGSRVTVAVVDDGVDVGHVDLRTAFSPQCSFDFVKVQKRFLTPKFTEGTQHGTQCAGLVVMEGEKCGLGVGHGATLGAIKLLGNDYLDDSLEGDALAFQKNVIDIYSVSWGPKDDGKTVEKPGKFTQEAIENGVKFGRAGKGNIFVWASGNGGLNGDNCALDGYVSNEYTISFGVVSSNGAPAEYAEGCSAVLAAVSGGDSMIQTTGLNSTCSAISGSSASAAIASGIIALALQVNPTLTQRDMQHLIVHSSNPSAIPAVQFQQNGVGLKFHPKVGFGLLDAQKLVEMAATWQNVVQRGECGEEFPNPTGSIDLSKCHLSKIERVVLRGSIFTKSRGHVKVQVESPRGTISELLPYRTTDSSSEHLLEWSLVSVHFFGEDPRGKWRIHVESLEKGEVDVKWWNFKVTGF